MAGPIKPQFPPLLADGFHRRTVAEIRAICVKAFPTSITRRGIMEHLEDIIRHLSADKVKGSLWIDGSFVTEKIDPSDVDIIVHVASAIYEGDSKKRGAVDWAVADERCSTHSSDGYAWIECKRGHPGHRESETIRKDWTDWFGGHKPGYIPKGIIVLSLPARTT